MYWAPVAFLILFLIQLQTVPDEYILETQRAGSFYVGMSQADLAEKFQQKENQSKMRVATEYNALGQPYVMFYIYGTIQSATTQRGKPQLKIQIDGDLRPTVARILIYDPKFKTSKGIGVGSTLGDLEAAYTLSEFEFVEGKLIAATTDPVAVFCFNYKRSAQDCLKTDMNLIPRDIKIEFIIIY